ncbi:hypothetical protein D3C76_1378120 [compost metagenome]
MFTAMSAKITRTTIAAESINADTTGDNTEAEALTLVRMPNPISTMLDGDNPVPSPAALALIDRIVLMMDIEIAGPFWSSHQKKPKVPKKRMVSAKNDCRSAFRNAMRP